MNRSRDQIVQACLALLALFILGNLIMGSVRIQEAASHDFHGGMCGACQSCADAICDKQYGFDSWYIYLSLFLFSLIVVYVTTLRYKLDLGRSLVISWISGLIWVVVMEVLVRICRVPVLYTHFMEGRQSLIYRAYFHLGSDGWIQYGLFVLSLSAILATVIGYLFGAITHLLSHGKLEDHSAD